MCHLRLLAFATFLLVSQTACLSGSESPTPGVPALGLPTCAGAAVCGRFDFGSVAIGGRIDAKLSVMNRGDAAYKIEDIVPDPGLDASFRIVSSQFVVEPGDTVEVPLAFEPTHDGGVIRGGLVLKLSNADPGEVRVELSGTADLKVSAPESVSFGMVLLGKVGTTQVVVENPTSIDQTFTTSLTGDFRVDAPTGEILAPAKGKVTLTVAFEPKKAGAQSGELTLLGHGKPGRVVALHGTTLDRLLEVKPVVDFGFVAPGEMLKARVAFKNVGVRDITLLGLHLAQPAGKGTVFAVEATNLTVAAGGSVEVEVTFAPALLGEHVGSLTYRSNADLGPDGEIELRGFAGGPRLVVGGNPGFGLVGTGTRLERVLSIRNEGAAVAGMTDGRLKLGALDSGAWTTRGPELVGESAGEFAVATPLPDYDANGIPPGGHVELRVTFSPSSAGFKKATVRIFSNDPVRATAEVPVSGVSDALPTCEYELTPPRLNYGNVESSVALTMEVWVRNTAQEEEKTCRIYDVIPEAGSSFGELSFPAGPISDAVIEAGTSRSFKLRFSGTGTLLFFVSSTSQPVSRLEVAQSTQAGCLQINPVDWSYGTVEINESSTKEIAVTNTCPAAQHLTRLTVQAGLSTEFALAKAPTPPAELGPGASVRFDVVYRPTDVGEDYGSLMVQTAEYVAPYVATFAGVGARAQ